ncbi:hypothetical protein PG984_011836 [Apiospora sp. TS-2023a]
MTGAEVLGVISAVIAIVDGMKQLYDGATDATGLPKAFREVAVRLPLVNVILGSVHRHLQHNEVNESSLGAMKAVLHQAQSKTADLKKLFDKVIPLDEDPRWDRYVKLARTLGKSGKVETLMVGLMTDVQLLLGKMGLENSTAQEVHELRHAIQEISDMEPSIPDHEFPRETFTNNHYGSGSQTNNNVAGDAKIAQNYGSGKQYLAETQNFVRYERPETPPDPSAILPFGRDKDFILRGDLLDRIRRACDQPSSRIALVGLGGVGKSQLAIEYAHQVRQDLPDTWVFWVHASNAARFGQSFREIADHVKIPGRKEPQCNIFQLVRDWLRGGRNRKWRLILDNVDDASFLLVKAAENHTCNASQPSPLRLVDYLPACPNGSILITSRSRAAARELVEESEIISLEPMSQTQAVALIETKLPGDRDRSHIEELATALEFMPLAIIEATCYISRMRPLWSVQRYLEQFRLSEARRTELLHHEGGHLRRDGEAKNSILVTWQISFDHIRQVRPQAAELLSLMSFFDCQGIPSYILRGCRLRGCREEFCTGQDEISGYSGAFDEDMLLLRDYSFVSFSEHAGHPGICGNLEMHRLVQLATRRWLQESGHYERIEEEFLTLLRVHLPSGGLPSGGLPSGGYEYWGTWRLLLPHAKSAEMLRLRTNKSLLEWASVLCYTANYLNSIGDKIETEKLSIMGMETIMGILGRDHVDSFRAMGMVAVAYYLNGRWKESEELHRVVLEALKQKLGAEHEETLGSMYSLASTLQRQGRWEDAIALIEEVVDIRKKWLGVNHPETLACMEARAIAYLHQNRLEDAEALEMEVFETRKKKLGRNHSSTLMAMSNLARILKSRGRWEAAQELAEEVLETHMKMHEEGEPLDLINMSLHACALKVLGQDTDAILLMEELLQHFESWVDFTTEHPIYVQSRHTLDHWKGEQPKHNQSEK